MRNTERLTVSDEHIYQYLQSSRRDQLLWITGVMTVLVGTLAATRMIMLGVSSSYLVGPVVFSLLTILLIAIKNGLPLKLASAQVILTALLGTAWVAQSTGGIHSPLVMILPFVPLLGCVLLGRQGGIIFAGLALLTIYGLTYLSEGEPFSAAEGITGLKPTWAKGGFLSALVIVSTIMAHHQSRIGDAMAATIWNHATHDYLTGLPNRRQLDAVLERDFNIARREQTYIAALLIDIDRFKQFNDANGHLQGDECLRQVAGELAKCLRRPSDLVGRFGGEEFLVIMPGTDSNGAATVAESMRTAIEALKIKSYSNGADGKQQFVTISTGICCIPARSACSQSDLIDGADRALYLAKNNGRNRVELLTQLPCETEISETYSEYPAMKQAQS